METSIRVRELPKTEFPRIMALATEKRGLISLSIGEPDFTTPRHIIRAAKVYLDRGFTHYSAMQGRAELRAELARKLKKENKVKVSPDQIIVTCGSKEALFLSMAALLNPGEAVIVPDPGYLAFIPIVEFFNASPISIQLREEENFEYNPDAIERAIIPKKTKILIINSPSNPTGTVFSKKRLEELADVAVEHDLIIISDEAYEKLIYDDAKHISPASLNGMEDRVITVQTFSKSYAMTGWRVGYAAGPKQIIDAMTKLHLCSTICAPTISQLAALAALKGPQSCIERMRVEYDRRRKCIIKRINEIDGLHCLNPKGAFYAWVNISRTGMDSLSFTNFLLEHAKVIVVPGTEFGKYGEGYVRMSYATDLKAIELAMDRIERALKRRTKRKSK